jgi:hypothetical protein
MSPLNAIAFRCIAAITAAFFCVYANGISVVWLVYEFEREDIIANYYQYADPEDCATSRSEAGRIYVAARLDASMPQAEIAATDTHGQSAPPPPAHLQELYAVLNDAMTSVHSQAAFRLARYTSSAHLRRGCYVRIFRPPRFS